VVDVQIVLNLAGQNESDLQILMWHLIEDFFEQSIVMQAFIAWGWLSVIIMLTSIFLS